MPFLNVSAPRGFYLYREGGKAEVRRIVRPVNLQSNTLARGDAYTIDSAGQVSRAGAGDVVVGIVEGIDLNPIPASPQGPVSQDFILSGDGGNIIGIEDQDAEFAVQTGAGFDNTTMINGLFSHTDAAPDTTLAISRQLLNVAGGPGTNFRLIGIVNDPAGQTPTGDFTWVVVILAAIQ